MDEQNLQNPTPSSEPQTSGSIPPPPAPEVNLRTQESDLSSLQASGGLSPTPEPVLPEDLGEQLSAPPQTPAPSDFPVATSEGGDQRWLWWVLVIVILAAFLGGLYFYFSAPANPLDLDRGEVVLSPPEAILSPTPVTPPESSHRSAFGIPTENTSQITPDIQALKAEAAKLLPPGDLKEVSVLANGNQVPFVSFLTALAPAAASSPLIDVLQKNFEDDFTAFLYYDENGVWPGYIVRMKADAAIDPVSLRSQLAAIEVLDHSGFYLNPPGQMNAFRDGQVNSQPTRYATFAQPGAALNYSLIGRYLVISTSYSGFLRALQFLNF